MQTWGRFFSALVLAPVAGGVAAFLLGMSFVFFIGKISERNIRDAAQLGLTLGFWALLISLAYVLVIGTAAYAYARISGRTMTLGVALIVGLIAGVAPFAIAEFRKGDYSNGTWLVLGLALICSIATAWTFWRVAFAERAAA